MTEQEICDRLLVAIGATSDIENIHVRRRAAKAAAPEVLAMLSGLEEDSRKLTALEAAGVDNWEGYGHAMSFFYGDEDED